MLWEATTLACASKITARELVALQAQYPEIAATCPLAEAFKDFDASTGYDLPLGDAHYHAVARWLLDEHKRRIT